MAQKRFLPGKHFVIEVIYNASFFNFFFFFRKNNMQKISGRKRRKIGVPLCFFFTFKKHVELGAIMVLGNMKKVKYKVT